MAHSNLTRFSITNVQNLPMLDQIKSQQRKIISDELFKDLYLFWPLIRFPIVAFGFWSNIITMRTFRRMGLKDMITISFFVMTVSDFCTTITAGITVPLHIISYLEAKSRIFLKIQPILLNMYSMVSGIPFNNLATFITTFLAVQRCLCIIRPLQFKGMMTQKKSWGAIFVMMIASSGPTLVYYASFVPTPKLNTYWNATQIVMTFTPWYKYAIEHVGTVYYTVMPVVCQVIIFVCVILMGNELRASARFRKGATTQVVASLDATQTKNQEKREGNTGSREHTAIIQVMLISIIFLVGNSPKIIRGLASNIEPGFSGTGAYKNFFGVFTNVRFTFEYISAAVNFLVYYKYNSRFRKLCFNSK